MRETEENNSKLEDRTLETTLREQQKENRLKKWAESQGSVGL